MTSLGGRSASARWSDDAPEPCVISLDEPGAGVVAVLVAGDVDPRAAEHLAGHLHDAIRIAGPNGTVRIVLDRARFVGASSLQALEDAHEQAQLEHVFMELADPSPPVRRLLSVTGLEQRFGISGAHDGWERS